MSAERLRPSDSRSVDSPTAAWLRAGTRLLAHPELWPTGVRQARRLTPADWWRRPPFLPLPDRGYLRFRLETQYGARPGTDGSAPLRVDPDDVLTYLRWCREQERALHGRAPRTRAGPTWPRR